MKDKRDRKFLFEIKDRKSGKVLHAFEATYKVSKKEMGSPMFMQALVQQRERLLDKVFRVTCQEIKRRKKA